MDDKPAKSVPEFYKAHEADFAQLPKASREPLEILLRSAWPEMPKTP